MIPPKGMLKLMVDMSEADDNIGVIGADHMVMEAYLQGSAIL